MSSSQAIYRAVLVASFVEKIPHVKGWWYRLPLRVTLTQDGQPLPFEAILPHMGTIWANRACHVRVIMYEMGC
jgi:hypothetical protein